MKIKVTTKYIEFADYPWVLKIILAINFLTHLSLVMFEQKWKVRAHLILKELIFMKLTKGFPSMCSSQSHLYLKLRPQKESDPDKNHLHLLALLISSSQYLQVRLLDLLLEWNLWQYLCHFFSIQLKFLFRLKFLQHEIFVSLHRINHLSTKDPLTPYLNFQY